MRETVTEYEEVEQEVEKVYCDTCGGECTDDYKIEASEVCSGCASGSYYDTLKGYMQFEDREMDDSFGLESFSIGVILAPVILMASFDDSRSGVDGKVTTHDARLMATVMIGSAVWTILLIGLLVVR